MKYSVSIFLLALFCVTVSSRSLVRLPENDCRRLDVSDPNDSLDFGKFLSHFYSWDKDRISTDIFGDIMDRKRCLNVNRGKKWLEWLPADLVHDPRMADDNVSWYGGHIVRHGEVIVAFMTRSCENSDASEFLMFNDAVIATYAPDGHMIDSRMIARMGYVCKAWMVEAEGDIDNMVFDIEQSSLPDSTVLYDDDVDLNYEVRRYEVSVSSDGKISRKETSRPSVRIVRRSWDDGADVCFADLMSCFTEWRTGDPYERNVDRDEINKSLIKRFLPSDIRCQCRTKELWFTACHYVDLGSCYALFLLKNCDYPKNDGSDDAVSYLPDRGYLFTDYLLVTFTKSGRLIDIRTIARSGDLWPMVLSFDGCTAKVCQGVLEDLTDESPKEVSAAIRSYTLSSDGRITSRLEKDVHTVPLKDDGLIDPSVLE